MHSESQASAVGRPLGFDRQEAVDQLLVLFLEYGYDQVSQQKMASATGLSTSSLYNSFGTKKETFREVMRRYLELADDVFAPLEHGERGREDLLSCLELLEHTLASPLGRAGCLATISMVTFAGRDREIDALAAKHRGRLRKGIVAAITRGRALGEPLPDPDTIAPMLVAGVIGALATARATAAGPEAHEQFEALRALVNSWA